jgi:hypothetical protein
VTIGGSIALIIVGAILRFGITWKPSHVDLQAIGLILVIVFLVIRRRDRASTDVYEERHYTERPS